MHSSKRGTDVKNRLSDSVGEGKGGMIWENSIETCMEKAMATHSSVLAWRIPGTGEPGGLPSMGVTQSRTQLKRLSSSSSSTSLWEKVRVGWFERIAVKHVYYHMWNRWPVQVQCMKQGTQSQYTGTTLWMGWEGGGRGFRTGDTCTPMAGSCQCMVKATTIL